MLFVGDDWAEDHHDVCLQDGAGRVLAARRLPEGVAGIARLHELVAGHLDGDDPGQVVLAIETGRGPWVRALVAAGYRVFAVNPKQAARHREVVAVSARRMTPSTRPRWRTWRGPAVTSCAKSRLTATRRRR